MGPVRVKSVYRDERLLNDFLGLKDIELVKLHVRPLEYIVEYKKINKITKKQPVKKVNS